MIVASILTPLEDLLRHILNALHSIGLPWAWSIVGLTIIVRMLLVPLTVKQIHSMQNMQAHAPQMKEIQRKYKGDRTKLNEELMKFYKENNINPAASCLPLLAQLRRRGLRADMDYAGRSVALSGDTSPSDNLVAFCKGVDVLIHEAIDLDVLRRLVPNQQRMEAIVARHTTPEQARIIRTWCTCRKGARSSPT